MPFLDVKVSNNLYSEESLRPLLDLASQAISDGFSLKDETVKATVTPVDLFSIRGNSHAYNAFCYLTVLCFAERSAESRQQVVQSLAAILKAHFEEEPFEVSLAVYINPLERSQTWVGTTAKGTKGE